MTDHSGVNGLYKFFPRTAEKRNFGTTLETENMLITGTHFTACQPNAVSVQEKEIQQ